MNAIKKTLETLRTRKAIPKTPTRGGCARSVSRKTSCAKKCVKIPHPWRLCSVGFTKTSKRQKRLKILHPWRLCSVGFTKICKRKVSNALEDSPPVETFHKIGFAPKNSDTRYATSVGFTRQRWLPPVEDLPSRFRPEELEHPLGLSARKLLK